MTNVSIEFDLKKKGDRSHAVRARYGNADRAAEAMGCSRQTVYNWIKGEHGGSIHAQMLDGLTGRRRKTSRRGARAAGTTAARPGYTGQPSKRIDTSRQRNKGSNGPKASRAGASQKPAGRARRRASK